MHLEFIHQRAPILGTEGVKWGCKGGQGGWREGSRVIEWGRGGVQGWVDRLR